MKNTVRLDKFLASAGYGSRKDIKKLVKEGTVTVNGEVTRDSSVHVAPDKDTVTVNGVIIVYREHVYLMLNKPAGYVSATHDTREQTVIDLVPEEYRHFDLFPVGRLDKDTEGLLLLTNDGHLAHELLAPKKHVSKTYFVRVEGRVTEEHIDRFARGVVLDDGYETRPAEMEIMASGDISEVQLTIYEGKFHQIKRMFQSLDMQVIYLKRTAMGGLPLDSALTPGQLRELSGEEHFLLRRASPPSVAPVQ